jgi:hypothetical protein
MKEYTVLQNLGWGRYKIMAKDTSEVSVARVSEGSSLTHPAFISERATIKLGLLLDHKEDNMGRYTELTFKG